MIPEDLIMAIVAQSLCSESGEKYTEMSFDDAQKVHDWLSVHPDAVLVWSRPEINPT